MKLTEQQAFILLQTALDSLAFSGQPFTFNRDTRESAVNAVIGQMDKQIIELSPDEDSIEADNDC